MRTQKQHVSESKRAMSTPVSPASPASSERISALRKSHRKNSFIFTDTAGTDDGEADQSMTPTAANSCTNGITEGPCPPVPSQSVIDSQTSKIFHSNTTPVDTDQGDAVQVDAGLHHTESAEVSESVSAASNLQSNLSLSSIEFMMSRLLNASEERQRQYDLDSENRQREHITSIVTSTVAAQIQPIQQEIADERLERSRLMQSQQAEITALKAQMDSIEKRGLSSSSTTGTSKGITAEIVIGDFKNNSKAGAISMCEIYFLLEIAVNAQVIRERMSPTPPMVSIRFESV